MANQVREKYKYWIGGVVLAIMLLIIGNALTSSKKEQIQDSEKTIITANVPEDMKEHFTSIFDNHKLGNKYILEFTKSSNANFLVTEGMNNVNGELFVYTPFLAVIDDDSDFEENLKKEAYLVESACDSDKYDLDFKKIMQEIAKSESKFNVYYPEENSIYWEEFYAFLLITANDGTYPKNEADLQSAKKLVTEFLDSKNAIPFSKSSIKQIQAVPLYTMYFMTYVDYKDYFGSSESLELKYPKAVVNHNYYVSYDDTGKVMYDTLDTSVGFMGFMGLSGYDTLYNAYYNTINKDSVSGSSAGVRQNYNSVFIPGTVNAIYSEEEVQ